MAAVNDWLRPSDSKKLKLALISFVSLFLELVIIRWLASEVRIFAHFKNLPLFAAFLGLGAGFIIAPLRRNDFRYTPIFFAVLLKEISQQRRAMEAECITALDYSECWRNPFRRPQPRDKYCLSVETAWHLEHARAPPTVLNIRATVDKRVHPENPAAHGQISGALTYVVWSVKKYEQFRRRD
jgi:hypothetical protein